MKWTVENWFVLFGIIAMFVSAGFFMYRFFKLPRVEQIAKVKEWLKYAVAIAEKELGSGTGELKLRYVYDLFVGKFPAVAKIITFETFSGWVDDALEWLNEQLSSNESISELITGSEEESTNGGGE